MRLRAEAHRHRRRLGRERLRGGRAFRALNLADGTEHNHEPTERISVDALEGLLEVAIALVEESGRAPGEVAARDRPRVRAHRVRGQVGGRDHPRRRRALPPRRRRRGHARQGLASGGGRDPRARRRARVADPPAPRGDRRRRLARDPRRQARRPRRAAARDRPSASWPRRSASAPSTGRSCSSSTRAPGSATSASGCIVATELSDDPEPSPTRTSGSRSCRGRSTELDDAIAAVRGLEVADRAAVAGRAAAARLRDRVADDGDPRRGGGADSRPGADAYERGRPGYPRRGDRVALRSELGPRARDGRVLDVGAGTGKLTRELVRERRRP